MHEKLVPDAAREYLTLREADRKQGHLSHRQFTSFRCELRALQALYPLKDFPIMPRGFRRLRLKFRHHFKLTHDVLRHTFISMFVGKYRSLGDAALQAGNSEAIIRKHYLDLKSPAEAEEFFAIVPQRVPAGAAQPANVVQPPEFTGRRAKPAA